MSPWYDDSWKDGYDAWKLASPDDERDEECWHEEYEADLLGRARCGQCGHSWWLTDQEIAAERANVKAYDDLCREWEREQRIREWRDWITAPWRRLRNWWRGAGYVTDDEIPF